MTSAFPRNAKSSAKYRVFKFWKTVDLKGTPFHASYDLVPERKIRDDEMSDILFDAIVREIKTTNCAWMLYTVTKEVIEASGNAT